MFSFHEEAAAKTNHEVAKISHEATSEKTSVSRLLDLPQRLFRFSKRKKGEELWYQGRAKAIGI